MSNRDEMTYIIFEFSSKDPGGEKDL